MASGLNLLWIRRSVVRVHPAVPDGLRKPPTPAICRTPASVKRLRQNIGRRRRQRHSAKGKKLPRELGAESPSNHELWICAFNSDDIVLGVLLADLAGRLIFGRMAPGQQLLHTIPSDDNDPAFWRLSVDCSSL